MEIKDSVQQIREFISAADTETALDKTRALLMEHQLEEPLVHLDMIHSEWNDIKEQELNGLKRSQLQPVRSQLQIIFQDPYASLNPRMRIIEILQEGINA